MNRSIPFVLSLALIAPAALAEDQAQQSQQDQAQSEAAAAGAQDQAGASQDAAAAGDDQAQAAAGKQSGQKQAPTQMFIKDMYSHNLYEIQVSQLAQKHAQDDEIKELAQMLIKDHQQANQQLKQIAQSAQVQVQEQLDPVHQAKLQKFQQLPQTEFGRKYANDQVAGHMVAVLELTYQSKKAQNEQVKQFATKMLPKMQQHLKMATQIATTQAGGAGGSGEAQPASERQQGEQQQQEQQQQEQQQQQQEQDAAGESGQSGQDAAGQSSEQQ